MHAGRHVVCDFCCVKGKSELQLDVGTCLLFILALYTNDGISSGRNASFGPDNISMAGLHETSATDSHGTL